MGDTGMSRSPSATPSSDVNTTFSPMDIEMSRSPSATPPTRVGGEFRSPPALVERLITDEGSAARSSTYCLIIMFMNGNGLTAEVEWDIDLCCNDSKGLPPECVCKPSYWRRECQGKVVLWNGIPHQTRCDYKKIIDQARIDKPAPRSENTQAFVVGCLERIRSPATLVRFWTALKAQNVWTIKSMLDSYDGKEMIAQFTPGPAFRSDIPIRSEVVMVDNSGSLKTDERFEKGADKVVVDEGYVGAEGDMNRSVNMSGSAMST